MDISEAKNELESLFAPHIRQIVATWNEYGILFEGQYGISQGMIMRSQEDIKSILSENGAIKTEEMFGHATLVADLGWMYCLFRFDDRRHSLDIVTQDILCHYGSQDRQ